MYIRHRIQKALLDKTGKEPDTAVPYLTVMLLTKELPGIVDNLKKLADLPYVNAALIAVSTLKMDLILGNEDAKSTETDWCASSFA